MNTNFETIAFEKLGEIGILKVNREKKYNALNSQVLHELKDFLSSLSEGHELKGMIFTGAGDKAFIAGADIAEMSDMTVDEGHDFSTLGQDVTLLFESLNIPVIACVNGFALGGGCEMAMACDFIYATKTAVFGQPEVKLGLVPGFGGTQRLAKLIGRNRAKEIIYSGRNVDINEAKEIGLVVRSFDSQDEMISEAMKTLEAISKNSPNAVAISKQIMNEGNDLTNEQGLDIEARHFGDIFSSYDMKEGTKAFVEKRKPEFKGE
ncbi:putative 3-hydroxybutyryl-CoA dehydratase [Halobacteriovorax sp. BALOs_7]|uniref:Enoyl-CoA hydratase/isomerase family protein n=1 Tax=Halobacteriovorax vibrionivorans TaxID=2152716 RepID=A0ABY0IIF8_9BACT|nr:MULTISPECIES: enoyl-CoA hydratase-related protein [Halobacteriovorax]AYF43512.1 putative 3-hydroxybutyryl-CoA dehydratase [Halobacteriovorax sp. BALOs_7]RZF21918.1 enoyl-CoA hydratase/isomerase family protein [Halobacteriovorax vibrionivorans]TGD47240.1 enoyl-CoA hydratase/isomerase family protein [Halobacteriovorax sp. Y22]